MLIPINLAKKILKKAGAKRVSKTAKLKLAKLVEKYGLELAESSVKNAKIFGRKTIKEEDIKKIKLHREN